MPPGDADRIRAYAVKLVQKARSDGKTYKTLRAGDIHDSLGLRQSHANVGQALEGSQFLKQANVELVCYEGPESRRGANSCFTFKIFPYSDTNPELAPTLNRGKSLASLVEELTERVAELTQDDIARLVRAYVNANGLSDVEVLIVLRVKA